MGKPKNGTRLEPTMLWENHKSGRCDDSRVDQSAIYPRGVLSGILLRGWESQPHGEGPDGSTQLAKETYAGHAGSDHHKQTSLQGITIRAKACKHYRFRNLYGLLNVHLLRESWQNLNKDAASGVDEMTAEEYQKDLDNRLKNLAERLKTKRYRAKLVRRCYIPKEDGKLRPLGIPALEDKLVQLACGKVLNAIYEEDFLDCSNAYLFALTRFHAACMFSLENIRSNKFSFGLNVSTACRILLLCSDSI